MTLYLMQHGKAMRKEEDPERPLTEQGQQEVTQVAQFMARSGVQIDHIRHSGKRRAKDTADIVAQYLHAQEAVVAVSGMNPNDDVAPIAKDLQPETQAIMLVGHLPFLSRLASYLLVGDPERPLVQFQMGGVVCLELKAEQWNLEWMVIPELFC